MGSSAEPKPARNRLFLWVALAFVIQALAWGVFLWFAQHSNHDEVPLEHTRQVSP